MAEPLATPSRTRRAVDQAQRRALQGHRTVIVVGGILRRAGLVAWLLAVAAAAAMVVVAAVLAARHTDNGPVLAGSGLLAVVALAAPAVLAAFGWSARASGRILVDAADSIHDLVVTTDATNAPDRVRRVRGAVRWLRVVRAGGTNIPRALTTVVGRSKASALLISPWFLLASAVAAAVAVVEVLVAPVALVVVLLV